MARYTVTEQLGRGTRVFRGTVSIDGQTKDVAITCLPPGLTSNSKFVAMFVADMRSSLRLTHSNVVEVRDIAKTPENAYFVVTEYVNGCDLETLITRRKRIAIQHVLHVLIGCCNALAHAHARDVIHRNVSPRIMLRKRGVNPTLRRRGPATTLQRCVIARSELS